MIYLVSVSDAQELKMGAEPTSGLIIPQVEKMVFSLDGRSLCSENLLFDDGSSVGI